MSARRVYGDGSVYQRCEARYGCPPVVNGKRPAHKCRARWYGTVEDKRGDGKRHRPTVSGKTKIETIKKRTELERRINAGEVTTSDKVTVRVWADEYLKMRLRDMSPKGYNAAENPIKNWVLPTIGHKHLRTLTPSDVRAVHDACRAGGRSPGDVHRVLKTMLNAAVADGKHVPATALAVKAPVGGKSDREAMSIDEGIACLKVTAEIPHGSRWLFTLLYGARMGECLGLTWDAIDFDAGEFGEAVIDWQLQGLPYEHGCEGGACGKRPASCKRRRFRVPDDHESRHLVDSHHLVRPKSKAGYRVAPLLPGVRERLLQWREESPPSPHGLVWPALTGRPANNKSDRAEWWGLQNVAEVGHPSGRPYHVHECRNFAATMLLDAEVPEHVITDLLGHSTVATSLRYRTKRREPLMEGMRRVEKRLMLG